MTMARFAAFAMVSCLSQFVSFYYTNELKAGQESKTKPSKTVNPSVAGYHFSLGQAYSSDGDVDRAIEEYKLTLMYDSSSALVYTRLAGEYVKKGMLSAAMEACKEALKKNQNYVDAHLLVAELFSAERNYSEAIKSFDRVLKIDPKNEEAVLSKAQALVEDQKLELGAKVLQKYTEVAPESAGTFFYLGKIEQQLNRAQSAEKAFKKALELRPAFSQAALSLAGLYEEKRDTKKAVQVYQALFEINRDLTAANRLTLLFLKSEELEKALPYLKAIEMSDPDDFNAKVKLGLIYMELKKFDQAIAVFKKILDQKIDSDRVHYYLGTLYHETNQLSLGVEELKKINADSKLYPDSIVRCAQIYKQLGQIDDAKQTLRDGLKKSGGGASIYLYLATIEEESKNISGAISALESAEKLYPENEAIGYFLGTLYDKQGKVDQSLVKMEGILKLNPNNVDALNYLGYTWTQKGIRLHEAETVLKKALTLVPGNGYIQDSWGWLLFTQGRIKDSIIELEKAVKLKPNEPVILEHLGDAYLKANLTDKALVQYDDALKNSEDEDLKNRLRAKVGSLRNKSDLRTPAALSN